MELEEEGSLPFLDTKVTRLADGKLDITIYRKKTHTDRYLHFDSHHPRHMKRGTVSFLYNCARSITQQEESLRQEENHLMKTFIGNSYPQAFVKAALIPRPPRQTDDDNETDKEKPPTAFLPYVAGMSERIRKMCQDFNIRTMFRSGPTLRGLLTKVKKPSPSRSMRTSRTKCFAPAARCA